MACPVRLQGDDEDIVLVAQRARKAVEVDPQLARELLPGLSSLWRARQAANVPQPLEPQAVAVEEERGRALPGVLWSILAGLGLAAMLGFAWVLAPPVRGFSFATEVAQPVLVVAGTAALVLLLLVVTLDSLATAGQVGMAAVWAAIVSAISAFVFVYRLIVGSAAGTALPPQQMAMWFGWCLLLIAVALFLALRWRRRSHASEASRGASWRGAPDRRSDAKRVVGIARELAKKTSALPAVTDEWERSLAALEDVEAETIAQAKTLGPVSWLVWVVYDGDIDVRSLRIG